MREKVRRSGYYCLSTSSTTGTARSGLRISGTCPRNALKSHGVRAEFFELPTGAHGLGCGKGAEWAAWQAKCLEWFKARGPVKG